MKRTFSQLSFSDRRKIWGVVAQGFSDNRRRKQRKLIEYAQLLIEIVAKLKLGWAPAL